MDLSKLYSWLKKPILNNSIVIFRIVFALSLLIQTYYFIIEKFVEQNILKPFILFPFVDYIQPISEFYFFHWLINPMFILSIIMLTANIGMLINKIARISTFIFLCCFSYFWLLDKGYFNNHYYFISIICFLIILTNQNNPFNQNNYVPRIQLVALQAMIIIIYFIAGLNKLTPYWLIDMQPVTHILETKHNLTGHKFLINPITISMMTYGGLIYDLCIGFLLLIRPTKIFAFLLVILFNCINYFLFRDVGEIGAFPLIMISTLTLFISPKKWGEVFKINPFNEKYFFHNPIKDLIIISFIIIQCIIPFRHLLFSGYVDYNGIGQRFSWRMKTMYKEPHTTGGIAFDVHVKKNQNKQKIAHFNLSNIEDFSNKYDMPNMYLTNKQKTALFYYPDMIPKFCSSVEKILKKRLSKEIHGDFDIIINANCKVGFMGRSPKETINYNVDLTSTSSVDIKNWLYELK